MSAFTLARLVTAGLLLLALSRLPYSFYTLMRFVCCVVAAYGAYVAKENRQTAWLWAFGTTALLFNPFVPIRLDRSTWAVLDVVAAVLMLFSFTNSKLTGGQRPPR